LGYKRVFNNQAIRVGFMGDIRNQNSNNNNQRRSFLNSSLDFRLGYEWRQALHPKWSIFYGFDVATRLVNSKRTEFENTMFQGSEITYRRIVSEHNNRFGLGPVAGIQWNLSSRIALMAESRAYVFYNESFSSIKWREIPEQWKNNGNAFNDEKNNAVYTTRFDFFLPLDVFIIIKL
jgi:hypothetical protein